MKTLTPSDYHETGAWRMWVINKQEKYGAPKQGELPKIDEVVSISGEEIQCNKVEVLGDSEFNWYPHYIILQYK